MDKIVLADVQLTEFIRPRRTYLKNFSRWLPREPPNEKQNYGANFRKRAFLIRDGASLRLLKVSIIYELRTVLALAIHGRHLLGVDIWMADHDVSVDCNCQDGE